MNVLRGESAFISVYQRLMIVFQAQKTSLPASHGKGGLLSGLEEVYGAAVTWARRLRCQQSSVLSVQIGRSLP